MKVQGVKEHTSRPYLSEGGCLSLDYFSNHCYVPKALIPCEYPIQSRSDEDTDADRRVTG